MNTTWNTHWQERLRSGIGVLGFMTVTDLVESHPKASYEDLAELLPGFAPIQIQRLHSEESLGLDRTSRVRFWKTSLLRYLARHVPNGIRMHGDWPLTLALGSWAGSMPESEQKDCSEIVRRFKKLITEKPDDWFPSDDEVSFQEVFSMNS